MPRKKDGEFGGNEFASSFDHTPTPWELLPDGRIIHNPHQNNRRLHSMVIDICTMPYASVHRFTVQGFSNAHLIMAAGPLLEVARELLECGNNREKLARCVAEARKAVDFADGGEDTGLPNGMDEVSDATPNFGPSNIELTLKTQRQPKVDIRVKAKRYSKG